MKSGISLDTVQLGSPVVGAIGLGVVEPALGAVGAEATDTDANDVRGAVLQAISPVALAQPSQSDVQRKRREQRVILDLGARGQSNSLGILIEADNSLLVPLSGQEKGIKHSR